MGLSLRGAPTQLGRTAGPMGVLHGALPIEAVPAGPMDTGITVALVDLGQAGGAVVALGAAAGEAVDTVLAGAPVVAGAARTLIDVDVAHAPCGQGWGSDTHRAPPSPSPHVELGTVDHPSPGSFEVQLGEPGFQWRCAK